jgi:hypothetical protein
MCPFSVFLTPIYCSNSRTQLGVVLALLLLLAVLAVGFVFVIESVWVDVAISDLATTIFLTDRTGVATRAGRWTEELLALLHSH